MLLFFFFRLLVIQDQVAGRIEEVTTADFFSLLHVGKSLT